MVNPPILITMFIRSNLAISLDGKIATADRSHFYLGSEEDRSRMRALRRDTEAVIMGAQTIRSFKKPCLAQSSETHPVNVILSHNLSGFDPEWQFFKSEKIKRILFYTGNPTKESLNALTPSSLLIHLNPSAPTAPQVIKQLENQGIKSAIVEGGGSVMWDFVSHNLIDEYYVTLTPTLVGGTEAPTLVDGKGFSAQDVLKLDLTRHEVVGNEIFLTYRKKS